MNTKNPSFPWAFLALTFAFTWLLLLPGVLSNYGFVQLPFPALALVGLAQFGPSLAAFALTYHENGMSGVKRLLQRAFDLRVPGRWLAAAALIPPCLGAAGLGIFMLVSGERPALAMLSQPLSILPAFLSILFFYGPVPEEFGWRGYLLGRLQARWSPLVSSLILGIIWAIWHLPSWFMQGTFQSFAPFWMFLVLNLSLSVLFTWIYNHTNGNLFLALLFHTQVNLANVLFIYVGENASGNAQVFAYLVALYALAAFLVRNSLRGKQQHPAAFEPLPLAQQKS